MRWFTGREKALSAGQERFAARMAGRILTVQRRVANYLNGKTARVSTRHWLIYLVCFCLVFGAYLVYLLAQVFSGFKD